ncbi:1-acyl-sn-glycerol-3-phosphate acyltransferase [Dietzia sp.]|uniref:1-acyl-sn-glycerol-3-phosphate acyltransferase n=1 Tax=Dietzia sp. TaxID=1871616 RepID=UPI002FDAEB2D
MIRRLIARAYWKICRWRLVTQPAPERPTVLLGAPHTSNWDFILMLGIAWRLGMRIKWVGKDVLFRGPAGPFMRALGGIPVDRNNAGAVVTELVDELRTGAPFGLVITPDGTRGGHTHWKTGFYRIARESGLPVTLGFVDRSTRTTGLGPTFELTGDVAADMDRIRAFYSDKSGFHPKKAIEPRFRDESGKE